MKHRLRKQANRLTCWERRWPDEQTHLIGERHILLDPRTCGGLVMGGVLKQQDLCDLSPQPCIANRNEPDEVIEIGCSEEVSNLRIPCVRW